MPQTYRNELMIARAERNVFIVIAVVLLVFSLYTCNRMMQYRQAEIQKNQGGEIAR